MTKTVNGSFIIDCEVDSERHRELDIQHPYYEKEGKRINVNVIQVECVPYKDSLRFIYELVEV